MAPKHLSSSQRFELQSNLLIDAGWDGWWLLEANSKVPDRLQAMIEQRGTYDVRYETWVLENFVPKAAK